MSNKLTSSILLVLCVLLSLPAGAATIAAGTHLSCAVTSSGGVKCWGTGNGTPADVTGLTSGVSAVAAAGYTKCALTTGGGVKCWGHNESGQLGNGTTTDSTTPVDVTGLSSGVTAITVGGGHACALTMAGGVKCWGWNTSGQLGDNSTTQRLTPTDVSGLTSGVTAISAGESHTCAVTTTGGLKCWGSNDRGELGDDTVTKRLTPINVSGLTSGVSSVVASGYHTCAMTTAGGIKCWGFAYYGSLGDGTYTDRKLPADVSGITSGMTVLAARQDYFYATVCAGSASGVKCWGYNDAGQVGDGTTTTRNSPVTVSGLSAGVTELAVGSQHVCAKMTDGSVKCWGGNAYGALGDGTTTQRSTPVDVIGLGSSSTTVVSTQAAVLAAGDYHSCMITTAGGVKCWGDNGYGQLGNGTTTDSTTPVDVSGLTSGVTSVAAATNQTCALTTAGGVKCWGWNSYGELGDNTTTQRSTPVDVSGLTSGVAAITVGSHHACALTTTGGVKCWGYNTWGQLGDDTSTERHTPVDVSGLTSGIAAIAAGDSHTCAVTTTGGVKCWGRNGYGQLGDNTTTARSTAVAVSGLTSGVSAIGAGYSHSCALTTAGGVKCWGDNGRGQLGDNTTTSHSTPVDVSGLTSGVSAIAVADASFNCALTTAGGVKCWGRNDYGQLGDNSTTERHTPADVSGLTSGAAGIAAGGYHACAKTTTGSVKCWGRNSDGQLGDATTTQRLTPVTVSLTDAGSLALAQGWNLVGNSVQAPITVATTFGDTAKVDSVWKWVAANNNWAVYLPAMSSTELNSYVSGKGYTVLSSIAGGDGFWVKAKTAFTTQLPTGTAVASSSFQSMSSGWHLISTGATETPNSFNTDLSVTPPAAGVVPTNIKSLWVWNTSQSKWYFYAPGLEAKGGTALADFISGNGYLNFTTANQKLGPGIGFWVNVP